MGKGTLFITATPIGNLEDITIRALRVLREADIIAAEDTRHTLKLLNHYEIKTPVTSYHKHNERQKSRYLLKLLDEGNNVALVTDAGCPGVSDPGEEIIREAVEKDYCVTIVPGATAAITGLQISGLGMGKFAFEGFLPSIGKERRNTLNGLKREIRTMVFYEAPHRLKETLEDMLQVFGDRNIALAKELTKKHEKVLRVSIREAVSRFGEELPKGEYVLVVDGAERLTVEKEDMSVFDQLSVREHVEIYMDRGMSKKEAMKKTASDRKIGKREVYSALLKD